MNKWVLHVRDFGKIKKADVEVSPLTFFVGDNNSGKSYLMTLIYGLLNVKFYFERYTFDETTEAYQKCSQFIKNILKRTEVSDNDSYSCKMTAEIQKAFMQLLNEVLQKNQQKFLRELFNKDMEIGELSIELKENTKMEFETVCIYDIDEIKDSIILKSKIHGKSYNGYAMSKKDFWENRDYNFYLSYILEQLLQNGYVGRGSSKVIYLPTARTGFLLTYKTLVGSAMQDKFNLREDEKNLLTRPNSDFLKLLSSMRIDRENKENDEVVAFIEQNIISGHIGVSDLPSHDIMYTPKGGNIPLPMYVTSGVVTEMTPLLLFLKYMDIGTLLVEEPEISLHPKLQWQMARVLIQLKNAGIPVFVTTHSDIILQHINNMIKLEEKNDERKLTDSDYVQNDLLNREYVAVYQFDTDEDNHTQVKKLPCGDYGFEAMTFYNTLKELNEQTDWIEEE